MSATILWRRLDTPGHEAARLTMRDAFWHLDGTAVFADDGQPCRLDYLVICDTQWRTVSAQVLGWIGAHTVNIEISVDSARRWRLNGIERPEVSGCIDVDINFTPSTNLLPIRRLDLDLGQEAKVQAAWLRFPGFTLEPLEQLYRRRDDRTYHYESAGGRFAVDLDVDVVGFVTKYPGVWHADSR